MFRDYRIFFLFFVPRKNTRIVVVITNVVNLPLRILSLVKGVFVCLFLFFFLPKLPISLGFLFPLKFHFLHFFPHFFFNFRFALRKICQKCYFSSRKLHFCFLWVTKCFSPKKMQKFSVKIGVIIATRPR